METFLVILEGHRTREVLTKKFVDTLTLEKNIILKLHLPSLHYFNKRFKIDRNNHKTIDQHKKCERETECRLALLKEFTCLTFSDLLEDKECQNRISMN